VVVIACGAVEHAHSSASACARPVPRENMVMDDRPVARGSSRLAHGWRLMNSAEAPRKIINEFIRPAVRSVPSSMARRLGSCRILLLPLADSTVTSQWTETDLGLEVCVMTSGWEEHDVAMELLLCLGQALCGRLSANELQAYWNLLDREILEGIAGEIDEQALEEKRSLLASRSGSRRREQLERYGCASLAGTAAEYVHCLWHDVTVRTGPDHLPAPQLRRRLELLAQWFPPDRGYRLFPAGRPRWDANQS
jgi:hypothetical protein